MRRGAALGTVSFGAMAVVILSGCEAHWAAANRPIDGSSSGRIGAPEEPAQRALVADRALLEEALAREEAALRVAPEDPAHLERQLLLNVALLDLDERAAAWASEPSLAPRWLRSPSQSGSDGERLEAWLGSARRRLAAALAKGPPSRWGFGWAQRAGSQEDFASSLGAAGADSQAQGGGASLLESGSNASEPSLEPPGRASRPSAPADPSPPSSASFQFKRKSSGSWPVSDADSDAEGGRLHAAVAETTELSSSTLGELDRQVRFARACLPAAEFSRRITVVATLVGGRLQKPLVSAEAELPMVVEACILEALRRVKLDASEGAHRRTIEFALLAR